MHRTLGALLLLAIGAAAELVPLAPFPGKDVFGSTFWGVPTTSVIDNKIYWFGGSYAIPYLVDPNDFDSNPFRSNSYNVSSDVYSYDMQMDQWEFETTTPYPLTRATTQVVGDVIYFFNNYFESNVTRAVDVWTYHTLDKTWAKVNRLPFVWKSELVKCNRDGKIYMTGSEDGRQISQIHIYDSGSNSWEKDVITIDAQLEINTLGCLDDGSFRILGKTINQDQDGFRMINGRVDAQQMESAQIYPDGTVVMGKLTFEYHMLDSVRVVGDYLYLLDRNGDEIVLSKIDLETHEQTEITTINSKLSGTMMVPYGDELFLFGGTSFYNAGADDIKTFLHKYVAKQSIVQE